MRNFKTTKNKFQRQFVSVFFHWQKIKELLNMKYDTLHALGLQSSKNWKIKYDVLFDTTICILFTD